MLKKYGFTNIKLNIFLNKWKELTNYDPFGAEKDKETKSIINSLTELLKSKFSSTLTKRIELNDGFFTESQQFPNEVLDFSYYSELEQIINVSKIPGIIKKINVSHNKNLIELTFSNNKLTRLDLSNNPKLITLKVNDNQLVGLNLDNNPHLEYIDVSQNEIQGKWKLINCRKIKFFACHHNYLNELRINVNLLNVLMNSDKQSGLWTNLQPQKHDKNTNNPKEVRIHPTYHVVYDTPLEDEQQKQDKETTKITTDWSLILTELADFFRKTPTTLPEIINKGQQILKEKGDPLAGIDLKGADYTQLTTEKFGQNTTAVNELKTIQGKLERFSQKDDENWVKTYQVLEAHGDGNCYLNSLANLLTGDKSREKEVAVKLRVKLILELMTNKDIMEHTYPLDETSDKVNDGEVNDQNKLGWILYKMLDNRDDIHTPINSDNPKWELAINGSFMATDDVKYYVHLLKRPITVIYPAKGIAANNPDAVASGGFLQIAYPDWGEPPEVNNLLYEEPFFIYRLKNGAHFVPLVRLPNHEEGRIEFVADKIEWEEKEEWITWKFNQIELKGFSPTVQSKLDSQKLTEHKALRIVFDAKEEFQRVLPKVKPYTDPKTQETDTKLGRKWIIQIGNLVDAEVVDNKIHLNDDNMEDVILVKETNEDKKANLKKKISDRLSKYSQKVEFNLEEEYNRLVKIKTITGDGSEVWKWEDYVILSDEKEAERIANFDFVEENLLSILAELLIEYWLKTKNIELIDEYINSYKETAEKMVYDIKKTEIEKLRKRPTDAERENLKKEIEERLNKYPFAKSLLNYRGAKEKLWQITESWRNYFESIEDTKEIKSKILYFLADEVINYYLKKRNIKDIDNYMNDYNSVYEKLIFDKRKEEIEGIRRNPF